MPSTSQRLITITAVCEMLGISRWTVMRLADDGKLPRIAIGGSVRFDRQDIESWIRHKKAASKAAVETRKHSVQPKRRRGRPRKPAIAE